MAVLVTKPAPEFKAQAVMPDGSFKDISLADYRGKYVVLYFYPLDFTFVCPTEIIAISDANEKFAAKESAAQTEHSAQAAASSRAYAATASMHIRNPSASAYPRAATR